MGGASGIWKFHVWKLFPTHFPFPSWFRLTFPPKYHRIISTTYRGQMLHLLHLICVQKLEFVVWKFKNYNNNKKQCLKKLHPWWCMSDYIAFYNFLSWLFITGCSLNIVFFSEDFKIFLTLFSLSVSVFTHTRQVETQRCSRTGRVQKNHKKY